MTHNQLKKVVSINRGVLVAMIISVGVIVLELLGLTIGSFFVKDKVNAANLFIAVPSVAIFQNIWLLSMCSIAIYTTGFKNAVCSGMTRKSYLRGAYLMQLAYAGVAFLVSFVGSLIIILYSIGQPEAVAQKLRQNALLVAGLSGLQVIMFMFFVAIGMLLGVILMSYGAKMLSFALLAVSALFILAPKAFDYFDNVPKDDILSTCLLLGGAGVTVVALLTILGRQMIFRQNI